MALGVPLRMLLCPALPGDKPVLFLGCPALAVVHDLALAGLELIDSPASVSPPPKCWDERCVPQGLAPGCFYWKMISQPLTCLPLFQGLK